MWLVGEQSLEDLQGLLETINARAWRIEREPCLLIFAAHPACPQSKFEASAGEHIQRGHFLAQHHWVTIIVIEYHAAET